MQKYFGIYFALLLLQNNARCQENIISVFAAKNKLEIIGDDFLLQSELKTYGLVFRKDNLLKNKKNRYLGLEFSIMQKKIVIPFYNRINLDFENPLIRFTEPYLSLAVPATSRSSIGQNYFCDLGVFCGLKLRLKDIFIQNRNIDNEYFGIHKENHFLLEEYGNHSLSPSIGGQLKFGRTFNKCKIALGISYEYLMVGDFNFFVVTYNDKMINTETAYYIVDKGNNIIVNLSYYF